MLIERGAERVYAVDVGHDQLHQRLRDHPAVSNREGVNARDLTAADVHGPVDAVVADVSFISLRLRCRRRWRSRRPGRGACSWSSRNSRSAARRSARAASSAIRSGREAAADIAGWVSGEMGWTVDGLIDSPITGADGNHEFLLGARNGGM